MWKSAFGDGERPWIFRHTPSDVWTTELKERIQEVATGKKKAEPVGSYTTIFFDTYANITIGSRPP